MIFAIVSNFVMPRTMHFLLHFRYFKLISIVSLTILTNYRIVKYPFSVRYKTFGRCVKFFINPFFNNVKIHFICNNVFISWKVKVFCLKKKKKKHTG